MHKKTRNGARPGSISCGISQNLLTLIKNRSHILLAILALWYSPTVASPQIRHYSFHVVMYSKRLPQIELKVLGSSGVLGAKLKILWP